MLSHDKKSRQRMWTMWKKLWHSCIKYSKLRVPMCKYSIKDQQHEKYTRWSYIKPPYLGNREAIQFQTLLPPSTHVVLKLPSFLTFSNLIVFTKIVQTWRSNWFMDIDFWWTIGGWIFLVTFSWLKPAQNLMLYFYSFYFYSCSFFQLH